MNKILITGGSGKLGKELAKVFPESFIPSKEIMDITNHNLTINYIKKIQPDLVIHCAALTDIRTCETMKNLAWEINVEGTENIVKACQSLNKKNHLIYISTACVFYGDKGNYSELDTPYPKNFYALTKLLGEFIVKYSDLPKYTIIRTNFVPRERWPYPQAFQDRYGTYLFADDLSIAIKKLIKAKTYGLVHVCGDKKISMYNLAKITTPDVKPMTINDYEGPPLTMDMSLRSIRIKSIKMRY